MIVNRFLNDCWTTDNQLFNDS